MNILSIEHNLYEQVGINTTRHGGGGVFSRYGKQLLNDDNNEFLVCGYEKSFDNLSDLDNKKSCIILPDDVMDRLNSGYPLDQILPQVKDFDIVVHHRDSFAYNLGEMKAKQVYWSTFYDHTVSPKIDAALIYSYEQRLRYFPTNKVYKVVIGSYVPREFPDIQKEDYIFVCTRHDSTMDTNVILKLCIKYGIKCIVAGPILDSYPLLIDNIHIFYLGEITNEKKNELSKKAMLYSCIQNWETIFSLSAIESLAYGTPIIARNLGCFKYVLKDGINGFYFDGNDQTFLDIIENAKKLDLRKVWKSAWEFSDVAMVNSFYGAFKDILNK